MEVPLTKGYFAIIDDCDAEKVNKFKWCATVTPSGLVYAQRSFRSKSKTKTILMHRFIMDLSDRKILVDHRDRNGLNNSRSNLRFCNSIQNGQNRKSQSLSASQYLGVSIKINKNKLKSGLISCKTYWASYISINGKNTYLGCFINEIDAAKKYDEAAKINYGEFANLNFK